MSRQRLKRRKLKPKPLLQPLMKSLKRARQTTSEFHRIQRELDIARRRGGRQHINNYPVRGEQHELDHELSIIGGRQAYQEASLLTTGRHRTCKWVFSIITKLGLRPKKSQSPLEVLEVGAVNTQLLSVPWLSVRAIDIKAQHPQIEQCDFFDIVPGGDYNAVVMSME
mmetsp:Transcript_8832/g.32350  ORF Transcript_8832/g.32350 Transcript_8832/m.32350 type:complete len:168 (+) Transcript_8832:217-720(+)